MKLIKLTRGYFSQVDDKDYEYINKWKWHYNSGYAQRKEKDENGKWCIIYMHRIINNTPKGFDTDHKDKNKLNNQSENLRTSTRQENSRNRDFNSNNKLGIKGVIKVKDAYEVGITVDGKRIYLGYFKDIEKAKEAYINGSRKYFGENSGV